eukprot:CAMPEP_0116144590 /NCGR_PEP_ID=MMETSP0329-20121206/16091_1 /TAXON_ID=697910 /ORGANISM="Pseudo-nitzschia arenysensis, Strain B593" /LENGTH=543 /DNA_ID=CAMNT_0003640039 /DNA_START=9 /DNA_END=1640 /DNA_ORIENTATION=-
MTILCVATSENRLKVIEVDNETGQLVRLIQDIDPIVPPNNHEAADVTQTDEETLGENDTSENNNRKTATAVDKNTFLSSGILGSFSSSENATTEWIERHPTFDSLLYVFTSFWSKRSAIVTTYRILGIDGDQHTNDSNSTTTRIRGRLKKLGSVETKGLHVSHVTFSPDYYYYYSFVENKHKKPPSIMCVGHYMDGSLSFFDVTRDAALNEPIRKIVLPEVRPETRTTSFPNPLPSIHHVTYNPRPSSNNDDNDNDDELLCNYLLVSDTSKQGRVWTFKVDSIGLPISDKPVSFRKVTHITPPSGWLTRILTGSWLVGLADYRIRRCVVHPNGLYVYMLLEFNTSIQVYEMDPVKGRIAGDCLQEIPAIDPNYFGWQKRTGVGIHASAELYVTATEVVVSNRGFNFFGGAAESSVRIFSIQDHGAKLVLKQSLECRGPVRHFIADNHHNHSHRRIDPASTTTTTTTTTTTSSPVTLFVGCSKGRTPKDPNNTSTSHVKDTNSCAAIETYTRRDPEALGGIFERAAGHANVDGMNDITCIAVLD